MSFAQTNGLRFDGSNDFVSIASPYYTFTNALTVEWWANVSSAALGSGIGQGTSGADNMTDNVWLMHSQGTTITFYVNDNGNWRSAGPVAFSGGWHHYAGVANSSGIFFYVDGTLAASSSDGIASGIRNNSSSVIHMGKDVRYNDRFYAGSIDEVRIWNRALGQTEIQNNRSCEICSGSGLVEYYRFNQGTAGGSNGGINTVTDISGNGKTGVLNNFTLSGSISNWVTGNVSGSCTAVSAGTITGNINLSTTITTTLANATGSGAWSSANTAAATVNSGGVVTGVAAGTSTISYTVTSGFCTGAATAIVAVKTPNNAIHLDGGNDNVVIPNSSAFETTSGTIEMWVKPTWSPGTHGGNPTLISMRTTPIGTNTRYSFHMADGLSTIGMYNGSTFSTTPYTFTQNKWYHIAFVYSASSTAVYVNGVFIGNTGNVIQAGVSGRELKIGKADDDYTAENWTGGIDEVRVWNTMRTQSEIQASMNCDVAQNANLVAYYRFDQGTANGTNTGLTTASDYSGNGRNGTLTTMTLTGTTSNYVTGAVGGCNTITLVGPITGTATVCAGSTTTLSNATSGGTWNSGSTGIATVNSSGVVFGVAAGTATISYTASGTTVTTVVTVNPVPIAFGASGNTTLSTAITTTLSSASGGGVWTSVNTAVATIGSNTGIVSGVSAGTATISYAVTESGCTGHMSTVVYVKTATTGLSFDGTNDYVSLGSIALSSYTKEAWIYVTGTDRNNIISSVDSASALWAPAAYGRRLSSGHNGVFNSVQDPTPLDLNMWYHVAVTYDAATTTMKLYKNGVLVSSNTSVPAMLLSSAPVYIGSHNGGFVFQGKMDEVRIWNAALPQVLIANYMNCNSASGTELVAYYRFDNGIADGDNTGKNIAADYSGNNQCGTLVNFALTGTTSNYVTGSVGDCSGMPFSAAISGTPTACVGATATLSNALTGGTWSSGDGTIATVNASGVVTGVAAGVVTISYTRYCYPVTATFTVNASPSIAGTLTVCEGGTTALSASTGDWASSNTDVATVDGSGVVSGVSEGTATISFTSSAGCTSTAEVTVNGVPAGITGTTTVCMGNTVTLANASTGGTWSSSNTAVATINTATGVATGTGEGMATITYTLPTGCYTATGVTNFVAAIAGSSAMCTGLTTSLTDATPGGTWESSNPALGTVSTDGVVTAITGGTVTITYSADGCYKTKDITISTTPAAIAGATSLCVGVTGTLTNASAGGTWTAPSSSAISGPSGTGVVTGLAVGTAIVSYSLSSICYATAIVSVSAVPASITGTFRACPGTTTTLSNTTAGGTWSSANTSLATVDADGVVTGVSAGTVAISYTTSGGCAKTAMVSVNANPASSTGPGAVCESSSITLANGTSGGVSWISSNTAVATVNSVTGVVNGVAAGNADITFTLGTGCYTINNITVNARPAVIGGTLKSCIGETSALTDALAGGTWSSSNTAIASADMSTGVITGVAAGNATITYTSAAGCTRTGAYTVYALPAAISGYATACVGTTTTLTGGGGGTWSSSDAGVATVGVSTGAVSGVSAGTATISYILSSGCYSTRVATITAAPGAITGTATICSGTTSTLANALSGGVWSAANPAVATIGSASGVVTGIGSGVTNITYSFGTGCRVTRAVTVSAAAAISGPATVCVGSTVAWTNATSGGTWASGTTSVATIGTSGIITAISAGTADITYTTAIGCTATRTVTVTAVPDAITGTAVLCRGTTTTLSSATSGGVWTTSNGSIATVGSATGIVSALSSGNVSISYTMAGGCRATQAVTVNASATLTGASALCAGSTLTLSTSVSGGTWSSSDGTVATVGTSGIVSGVAAGNATITYTTAAGCTTIKAVTVNSSPGSFSGSASICVGSTTTLTNAASGGTWSAAASSAISGPSSTGIVTGMAAGTANITYTISGSCKSTLMVSVLALPASISGTKKVCETATTNLSSLTAGGTWSSSNTAVAIPGSATGVVLGIAPGTAIISYTGTNGCSRTTVFTVNANPATITGTYTVCAGASTALSNPTPGGLAWTSSNTSVATVSSGGGVVNGVAAGTSNITYTLGTGCFTTAAVTVDACPRPGGNVAATASGLQLYPNPTTGAFNVVSEVAGTLHLFTIDGKEVAKYDIASGINSLSLPQGIAVGVYMCRYIGNDGSTMMIRLIHEQ
ncbi:MAG: Ig-like domain-containing protein [Bacteroidota bacterium]